MSRRKYHFTAEQDEMIRSVYQTMTGNGEVKALAERLVVPRYAVTQRAIKLMVIHERYYQYRWSEKELEILERNAHHAPGTIQRRLKKYGFKRSIIGILLKRKRLRLAKNLNGYSAISLAECFGIDSHAIVRWIHQGLLKAKRRDLNRTPQQGGNPYYIKDKDIREFIINNISLIDIRKVEKFWFVDILTNSHAD